MSNRLRNQLFLSLRTAALVAGITLTGCADTARLELQIAELTSRNAALEETRQRLDAELREQKNSSARLQMMLVEKQAELERLNNTQNTATTVAADFPPGRIPPPGSKAEAVSCLAEAEIEIAAIGRIDAADNGPQDHSEVNDLLARSRAALERDDYQQSCSLANQALSTRRKAHLQTALSHRTNISPFASFLEPLTLQTTKRSNLRSRPGTRSRILATLDAASSVSASGYRGNWIKVTDNSGRAGWIHHTLLAVPASGSQAGENPSEAAVPLPADPKLQAKP